MSNTPNDNTFQKNRYLNKKSTFLLPTSTDEIFRTITNLNTTDSCGNDNISVQNNTKTYF